MTGNGFTLAASSEMLFLDLPHLERVRRIHELGFAVEIWDWTTKDIDALVATGATFTSMTGYVTGRLADADGADELLRTADTPSSSKASSPGSAGTAATASGSSPAAAR